MHGTEYYVQIMMMLTFNRSVGTYQLVTLSYNNLCCLFALATIKIIRFEKRSVILWSLCTVHSLDRIVFLPRIIIYMCGHLLGRKIPILLNITVKTT